MAVVYMLIFFFFFFLLLVFFFLFLFFGVLCTAVGPKPELAVSFYVVIKMIETPASEIYKTYGLYFPNITSNVVTCSISTPFRSLQYASARL